MSIFFLEGLPGAGKSYESVLRHLLPALKAGRSVVTNVPGLDVDKIKQHLGLTTLDLIYIDIDSPVRQAVDDCLQRCATANRPAIPAQMTTLSATTAQEIIDATLRKDALYLLDEIQNYFGASSSSLPPNTIRFFAEHRHHGLDIVVMGQNHRDVHDLIRHRIEVLTRLNKLTAIGSTKRYAWTNLSMGGLKPVKIAGGFEKYNPKIFDLYKSHSDATNNKSQYADTRNSALNTPFFKYLMPVVVFLLIFTGYNVIQMLFGKDNFAASVNKNADNTIKKSTSAVPAASSIPSLGPAPYPASAAHATPTSPLPASGVNLNVPSSGVVPAVSSVPAPPANPPFDINKTYITTPKSDYPVADYYDALLSAYRARYSAMIAKPDGSVVAGYFDIVRENMILERVKFASLLKSGYRLKFDTPGVRIYSPNGKTFLATAFPIDERTTGENAGKFRSEIEPQKKP